MFAHLAEDEDGGICSPIASSAETKKTYNSWADMVENRESEDETNDKVISQTVPLTEVGWEFASHNKNALRSDTSTDTSTATSSTQSSHSNYAVGKICYYNTCKKYGIIVPNSKMYGQDKFVFFKIPTHATLNTRVRFTIEKTDKGSGFLAHVVEII